MENRKGGDGKKEYRKEKNPKRSRNKVKNWEEKERK